MIVVDASAVLAALFGESGVKAVAAAPSSSTSRRMSAVNHREAAEKTDSVTGAADGRVDQLPAAGDVAVVAITPTQARAAREAHASFGKGRDPARLTMGDGLADAPAAERGAPPPFTGEDFSRTDIRAAP